MNLNFTLFKERDFLAGNSKLMMQNDQNDQYLPRLLSDSIYLILYNF